MNKEMKNKKFGYKKDEKHSRKVMKTLKKVSSLKDKVNQKNKKKKKTQNFYYSLLTIVLLIFLCQIACSAILNISKIISYQAKVVTIKKSKIEAENKNSQLKKELKYFSSVESLEAIARNNLKMAGNDEVLIIINEIKKQNNQDEDKNKKGILYKLGKHDKQ